MLHPRPYSRGFLFTETKAINLFQGQTLQREGKYLPLRKFVLRFLHQEHSTSTNLTHETIMKKYHTTDYG